MKLGMTINGAGLLFAGLVHSLSPADSWAESGGDQMLDGIGETALIARYLLNGTTEDSSRNLSHAVLMAGKDAAAPVYSEDPRFGRVLSLAGPQSGQYLRLPGAMLAGIDSLSITGWIKLRSAPDGGRWFETGRPGAGRLQCTPSSAATPPVLVLAWETGEHQGTAVMPAQGAVAGTWTHLAVVIDGARQSLTVYRDGRRVGEVADAGWKPADVFSQADPSANFLIVGGTPEGHALHADLRDLRLYNIALGPAEVLRICTGIARAGEVAQDEDTPSVDPGTEEGGVTGPHYAGLAAVPALRIETRAGVLPRLPYYLPGIYRDGVEGPPVRVVWPAPVDNRPFLEPGRQDIAGTVPGTGFVARATVTVRPVGTALAAPAIRIDGAWQALALPGYVPGSVEGPERVLRPFALEAVTLLPDDLGRDTPFMENRDKFVRGLLASDPHRYLYMFRHAFGQPQPDGVEPLRGWDNTTSKLRGHASGHYLTALAQAYAGARDEATRAALLEKMTVMIDTLHALAQLSGRPQAEGGPRNADPAAVPPGPGRDGYDSDLGDAGIRTDYWNWGEGFISAYPPDQFIMLEAGATYGRRDDQIWAPYYTLDKILKGLIDCHEVTGNQQALDVAHGMGRWVETRLRSIPQETLNNMWNRYIAGEHGGMNTEMARLHALTGDDRLLSGARQFDNVMFFYGDAERSHGLVRNVDTLRGRHANQHIPQIYGALHLFEQTGEAAYFRMVENFWTITTHSYRYSIGGVAGARDPNNCECFPAEPDALFAKGFSRTGQNETCATYNLLKLARKLFMFDPQGRYMDYYEQALYNHILASVAEHDPGNTYHVPLNPGARKSFGNADMSGYTCCNGTALDSNTKLQDSIYLRSEDDTALHVNLYIPSRLHWAAHDVVVEQTTRFPYSDRTTLTIAGGGTFDLRVRVPRWATRGFHVRINGTAQDAKAVPGTYLSLGGTWSDGDVIELEMPFGFRLEPLMDQPHIASLFYGPVLLAVEEEEARDTWRAVTIDPADPGAGIEGDPATLHFRIGDLKLKPFYDYYSERHSVYLDIR